MPDKPITVSRARFARMAGVTPQAVSQWIADGLPAINAGKRGQRVEIDLDAALPWLIDHRGAPPGSERERLAKERADKLALQNAQTRRDLVRADHVEQTVSEALGLLKEQINGIPGRMASQLASIEDPAMCRSLLMGESARILASYKSSLETLAPDLEANE
jgi:phage terminase Nu1 subunit (DNA packaging protein)